MHSDIRGSRILQSRTENTTDDIRQGILDYEAGLGEALPVAIENIRRELLKRLPNCSLSPNLKSDGTV